LNCLFYVDEVPRDMFVVYYWLVPISIEQYRQ